MRSRENAPSPRVCDQDGLPSSIGTGSTCSGRPSLLTLIITLGPLAPPTEAVPPGGAASANRRAHIFGELQAKSNARRYVARAYTSGVGGK